MLIVLLCVALKSKLYTSYMWFRSGCSERVKRHHACRTLGNAAEDSNVADVDDPLKIVQRVFVDLTRVPITWCRSDRTSDAGAVYENTFLSVRRPGFGEACIHVIARRDVDLTKDTV